MHCGKVMKALNPKHTDEAQSAGLKLISRAPNSPNSMIYECPDCNENILIRVETVRKLAEQNNSKGYDCPNCKESRYQEHAKSAGLTILGPAQNTHNLLYQFDECGHKQEIGK
jgi:predicted RNA-binding Zn-ribbon protein involved in translation (DUF1610 family)